MKKFQDKVAVITGAGSGIGFALAERCAKEGMKVVLADIDDKFLRRALRKIQRVGADVISVWTDVSKVSDVEALAKKTLDTYGTVNLLINNAGIGNTKYTWEYTLKDWEWQLGVNLWGVIHGIRIFTPIMLDQGDECHIVNVSSMEGLFSGSGPGGCVYGVSKHGIVSLSETFRTDLELKGINKLKVSVVCPGFVNTKIFFGDIHRPEDFQNPPDKQVESDRGAKYIAKYVPSFEEGLELTSLMPPEEAANIIFQGIQEEKFYILTHKDELMKRLTKERFDEILKELDT
ncbi:MAG: SDR family NAD(P)-dependent oxidoreductase [Candidatus Hodarchaeales archaeon]|jgi:NAD(P)-dependent dehydrogenase (short-subunit alcohol dehydrogenase family)